MFFEKGHPTRVVFFILYIYIDDAAHVFVGEQGKCFSLAKAFTRPRQHLTSEPEELMGKQWVRCSRFRHAAVTYLELVPED
jgi:hypothetical protein